MRSRARKLMDELDRSTILRYTDYIQSIAPTTEWDTAKRWIFAFCSIHTSWESNVAGYKAVTALGPDATEGEITEALREARSGLHYVKGRNIRAFLDRFKQDPAKYSFGRTVTAKAQRDALAAELYGIGLAKVSFACELINPEAQLVCLDAHALRWITGDTNLNGKMGPARYRSIELAWLSAAREFGYSPIAARHATWDRIQNQPDMRYWSHAIED